MSQSGNQRIPVLDVGVQGSDAPVGAGGASMCSSSTLFPDGGRVKEMH